MKGLYWFEFVSSNNTVGLQRARGFNKHNITCTCNNLKVKGSFSKRNSIRHT